MKYFIATLTGLVAGFYICYICFVVTQPTDKKESTSISHDYIAVELLINRVQRLENGMSTLVDAYLVLEEKFRLHEYISDYKNNLHK